MFQVSIHILGSDLNIGVFDLFKVKMYLFFVDMWNLLFYCNVFGLIS